MFWCIASCDANVCWSVVVKTAELKSEAVIYRSVCFHSHQTPWPLVSDRKNEITNTSDKNKFPSKGCFEKPILSQWRWFRDLTRILPECLLNEVFRACTTGREFCGKRRTHWRDFISQLAWKSLTVLPDEMEEVTEEEWVSWWMDAVGTRLEVMWRCTMTWS